MRNLDSALAPVVAHLLEGATRRSDSILSAARARHERVLADADRRAADLVDEARAEGVLDAELAGGARLAAARRQGRELVLRARGEAYDAVRRDAVESLCAMAESPDAAHLAERLAAGARSRLASVRGETGTGTPRVVHGSGVALEVGDGRRRVAVDAEGLVDEVLQVMAGEVEQLWA
ncbi:MAG: hypothetical protein KGJ77_00890 [Acidobacteriota bacterium]|nr:hypothetical protein [Acidobacteriota bacterium]